MNFRHTSSRDWSSNCILGMFVAFLSGTFGVAFGAPPATRPGEGKPQFDFQLISRVGEQADPRTPSVDREPVFRVRFDTKGSRLLVAMEDEVRVYDVPAMTLAMKSLSVKPHLSAADLSPDGTLIVTAEGDGTLCVRHVGVDQPLWVRRHEAGYEWSIFTPDGQSVLAIERGGKSVHQLDATSGRDRLTIIDKTCDYQLAATLSQDGSCLMTASLGPTRIWSVKTGERLATGPQFGDLFAISATGDRFAGQNQAGEVTICDRTGRIVSTIESVKRGDSQVANVLAIAFSPDGSRIATAVDDLGFRLWDVVTGKPLSTYFVVEPHGKPTILFTPDGSQVVVSDDEGASVWDVASGTRVALMDRTTLQKSAAAGTAITADGRYLAVNYGGPVELWHRKP